MTKTFTELGLNEKLSQALEKLEITELTEIQQRVIPIALEKKDIIAQAPTGTGKTFAYLLPLFQTLAQKPEVQVIILSPTHELSSQIKSQVELLAKKSEIPITYALIIGEVNIKRQIDKMKEKPNIIIGSTGRILELIEKKKIKTQTINTLVIDEADRMLDIKNLSQVKQIIKTLPKERQTILVSASIHNSNITTAKEFMIDPEIISIEKNSVPKNISHSYYILQNKDKTETLRRLINFLKPDKSLVFVQHSDSIERLTEEVKYHGLKVGGLYGNQSKEERQKVVEDFKKGKIQIMFATDIAARGLDIKGVTHVFNFDLPKDSEAYQHRSGRTGRQKAEGETISLVNADEKPFLNKVSRELDITMNLKSF